MLKKHNLTEFIQIRVNKEEKALIQLLAQKHSRKGVSALIFSMLFDEIGRVSGFDEEINEARKKLMRV